MCSSYKYEGLKCSRGLCLRVNAINFCYVLTSSSFYGASVANAPNVLQPYWLIVLPLDVPALTASLLL